MLLIRKLVVHTIIKILVVKLLVLPIDLTHQRTKPQNEVFVLHELLRLSYHSLLVDSFSGVERGKHD